MISLERNFIYTLAKLENESYNEMFNKETFEYMRYNVYYNEPENYDLWLTSEIKNFKNGLEWALNYMEKRCVSLLGFKLISCNSACRAACNSCKYNDILPKNKVVPIFIFKRRFGIVDK